MQMVNMPWMLGQIKAAAGNMAPDMQLIVSFQLRLGHLSHFPDLE